MGYRTRTVYCGRPFASDALTTPHTVITDIAVSAKSLSSASAVSYAIAGQGEVHLAANIGDSKIEVTKGHHDFQTRAVLDSNTTADIASGATLEFNYRLSLGGNTLAKIGGETLLVHNNLNTGVGSIVADQGVVGGAGTIGGDVTNDGGTTSPVT